MRTRTIVVCGLTYSLPFIPALIVLLIYGTAHSLLITLAIAMLGGFLLRKPIGEAIAAVCLRWEKSIEPGDYIQVEEIRGLVKSIQPKHTVLQTDTGAQLAIKNSELLTKIVRRISKPGDSIAVSLSIHTTSDADPEQLGSILCGAAIQDPLICAKPVPELRLVAIREGGFECELILWTQIHPLSITSWLSNLREELNAVLAWRGIDATISEATFSGLKS